MSGCVLFFHEYASLVGPLPAHNNAYLIRVQQVEGPMTFNSHAGAFGRTLVNTDVWLPRAPSGRTTYIASELRMESHDNANRNALPIGGTLEVGEGNKAIVINLQTQNGPSLINGTYDLRIERP
jgi:hypothetical protein